MPDYEKNEQAAAKAEKPKKDKDVKKSKPGFFARIGKWFREMKVELKKVQWPSRKQTINNTVVVIVCCIVIGICIWAFDWLAQSVFAALMNLFKG